MGHRIDDLEKNIADLMTQAGVEDKWSLSAAAAAYRIVYIRRLIQTDNCI